MNKKEKELSDQDLNCITRLLQSVLFADSLFYGCNYCKYRNECFNGNKPENMYIDKLRRKLQDITGLDLDFKCDRNNLETKFKNYQSVR